MTRENPQSLSSQVGALSSDRRKQLLLANLKTAVQSLLLSKQRTLLALLGIAIGVASVIAMVSITGVAERESMRHITELGINNLTLYSPRIERQGQSTTMPFRLRDLERMPSQVQAVLFAVPVTRQGRARLTTYDGRNLQSRGLFGVTESYFDMYKLSMRHGRFISGLDARNQYCVLGQELAQSMGVADQADLIGKPINVNGFAYTIVGVIDPLAEGLNDKHSADMGVFIPIRTHMRNSENAKIYEALIRITPNIAHAVIEQDVRRYLRRTANLTIDVQSPLQLLKQMENQAAIFSLLLGLIGSISLIVGGIGVMNVMLISVSERRTEIGIRRALGSRREDIQSQFLIESVLLSLSGGAVGSFIGLSVVWGICLGLNWEFYVSAIAVLLGVGVSSMVGVFFGYYPARHASHLDPIAALRA